MKLKYPNLFQPLQIKGKRLKNRVVSSPHGGGPNFFQAGHNGLSHITESCARYFGNIARGGAAIVNTAHLGVDPRYYLGSNMERFDFFSENQIHEHQLPVMHELTDLVHSFGSLASIELNHPGHFGTPLEGETLIGPVDTVLDTGEVIRGMDEAEMELVADYFANAAWIGKRGGFDIVNVHAAHNWLLGEFLSPIENTRTDQYGGSVENRARFPLMVIDRIRQKVGDDMLIAMRFSATEDAVGGITMEEAMQTIELFDGKVDILQCSSGMIHDSFTEGHTFPMQYMEHGCNAIFAREAKKHVKHTLIETVGAINEPEMAERFVAEGWADLIGMARSFIADPQWARKAKEGRDADIRPCIRCMRCLNYSFPPQTGTSVCTVNPWRVLPHPLPPVGGSQPRKVAVIGGGPAGMQAAVAAANNRRKVTLFEQTDKLGGRLAFADHMFFKQDIRRYRDYLIHQVEQNENITVCLGVHVTPESLGEDWDAVVLAMGAKPVVPPIPGADLPHVLHAADLYDHVAELGRHIVMVGGGQVGCEQTVWLQTMGKEVDVVEMADRLMPESHEIPEDRFWTAFFMEHELDLAHRDLNTVKKIDRVRSHLNSKCVEICEKGVWIEQQGERRFLPADNVILATGFRPDEAEKAAFAQAAMDVIPAGDCIKTGDLRQCSATGLAAAFQI